MLSMHLQRILKDEQHRLLRRALPAWRFFLASGFALLVAFFLFRPPFSSNLAALLTSTGLDPLRAALAAALLLTAGAAMAGALISRQRPGAILGAGVWYSISYVFPFVHMEQLPVHDPGGHLEALNSSALEHTAVVMLASGLLCAFLGAAVGRALGEVLLDPLWQLAQLIWHGFPRSPLAKKQAGALAEEPRKPGLLRLFWNWAGLFALLGLALLSTGIGDLFLFSPDVGLHNPPVVATHGTLLAESMVSPAFRGKRRSFLVYLPPSYADPLARARRYPTLYLLHGSPGGEYDWIRGGKAAQSADTLIAHGEIPELIMVFPDGNGRSGVTSEWGNSFDQRQLMENFVAFDLVHYIDQKYRTRADAGDRAIGGLSMGGFGAMNIAVHHPTIFGSVISLGGYYKAEGSIWGKNAAYLRANSPADVLPESPAAWKLRIFLGAATRDQPYYRDTRLFMQELSAIHLAYTFDLENGYHAWSVWETQLYHALLWLRWG